VDQEDVPDRDNDQQEHSAASGLVNSQSLDWLLLRGGARFGHLFVRVADVLAPDLEALDPKPRCSADRPSAPPAALRMSVDGPFLSIRDVRSQDGY
jgi:hypothetical protein